MQSSTRTTEPSEAENAGAEPRPAADPPDGRGGRVAALAGRRGFWPLALLVGYVTQVAFRLALVTGQRFPTVHPDEAMYLVLARMLAGRPTTEIPGNEVIPGGYPLLISPALRLTDDPVLAYHLIMGINALLSALVLPLAYVALRRLAVSRPLALAFAMATALLPPVVFYSQFAMADTPLPALVLAWLIGMHGLLSDGPMRRRVGFGLLAGFASGFTLLVHDRGGVIVAVTAVVLLVTLVLGWAPRAAAALALVGPAVMFLAKQRMTAWFLAHIDGAHPSDVGNAVLDTLKNPHMLHRTETRVLGHLWYFVTSTWGLGGLGALVCVLAVFSSRRSRADRVVAVVVLALLGGIALAASAGLPNDHRIDTVTYARYLSPLVPVFFVVAATVLSSLADRRKLLWLGLATAVLTMAATKLLIHMAWNQFHKDWFILWGLPDSTFLSSRWSGEWWRFHPLWTALGAVVALAVVVGLRLAVHGRRTAVGAGAGALALTLLAAYATVSITHHVTDDGPNLKNADVVAFMRDGGISPRDRVILDWDLKWELRTAMAFEVLDGRIWSRDVKKDTPPATANVAVVAFPGTGRPAAESWPHAPQGWHVTAVHGGGDQPETGYVVWRRDR